ncbi:MAG: hypothetical protein EAZ07_00330 [Cytophagales bacterium]|nr:MAG: hypothetical protein EAZ07_00330 [Cytophagales bacterium]
MKHFFIQLLKFTLLSALVFMILEYIFTSVYQNGKYYKTQWIGHIKNQNFDYIIHGSSRPYTCLDVASLNKSTGLKGLNLSLDGAVTPTYYLMLKMFLANGNTTKKIYLNIDNWEAGTEIVGNFTYPHFFPYLKDSIVFNHYKVYGLKWYAYRYIPFLRYAEFNTAWGIHQFANSIFHFKKPDYDEVGTKIYKTTSYHGPNELQTFEFNTKEKMKYLDAIIQLCKKEKIELYIFTAPLCILNNTSGYYKSVNDFKTLMNAKGIPYFNHGDLYVQKYNLFVDEDHLNKFGVPLYTEEFRKLLISTHQK